MRYKYPKLHNALLFRKINDEMEVIDYISETGYTFPIQVLRFAKRLDGNTNPYDIRTSMSREEVDEALEFMRENNLTRTRSTYKLSAGSIVNTMWDVPAKSPRLKLIAKIWNALLKLLWLPLLVIGLFCFADCWNNIDIAGIIIGGISGAVAGLVLHEIGHAFAGIAYGARVFEMGLMVSHYVMPGAYVLMDPAPVKNRMKRIQILAAGVESNFLLAGLSLILGAYVTRLGGTCLMIAINNLFLGALNLTLIKGLDGTAIMSELLGMDDIIERAKRIVFNKKSRKRLASQGAYGRARVVLCYVLFVLQVALPVLLVANLLEIIVLCFT